MKVKTGRATATRAAGHKKMPALFVGHGNPLLAGSLSMASFVCS